MGTCRNTYVLHDAEVMVLPLAKDQKHCWVFYRSLLFSQLSCLLAPSLLLLTVTLKLLCYFCPPRMNHPYPGKWHFSSDQVSTAEHCQRGGAGQAWRVSFMAGTAPEAHGFCQWAGSSQQAVRGPPLTLAGCLFSFADLPVTRWGFTGNHLCLSPFHPSVPSEVTTVPLH